MRKVFICSLVIFYFFKAFAQIPGFIDNSFGDLGRVIFQNPEGSSTLAALKSSSDGKIYICGTLVSATEKMGYVAKYTIDGQPDNSFYNGNFYFTFKFDNSPFSVATDMVVLGDGKILVTGNIEDNLNPYHPAVAKFLPDGSPDPTFGNNGQVVLYGIEAKAFRVAMLYNYHFVVAGTAFYSKNPANLLLIGFLPGGVINTSFGNNGYVLMDLNNNSYDIPGSISFFNSRILVSSAAAIEGNDAVVLTAYTENGQLDDSFGVNGKVVYDGLHLFDSPFSYQPITRHTHDFSGKIWVASQYYGLNGYMGMLLRFLPDGTPDNTFGDFGMRLYDFGSESQANFKDIGIQLDGKILLTGEWLKLGYAKILFTRVESNGDLDPSIGENNAGFVLHSMQAGGMLGDGAYRLLYWSWLEKVFLSGWSSLQSDNGVFITRLFLANTVGKKTKHPDKLVKLEVLNDQIRIFLTSLERIESIKLYNSEGKMLKEYFLNDGMQYTNELLLMLPPNLKEGLYFINVFTASENYRLKFLKL